MRRLTLTLLLALLLFSIPAIAANYHVCVGGTDSPRGCTDNSGDCCKTPTYAIPKMVSGDTLIVKSGTYTDTDWPPTLKTDAQSCSWGEVTWGETNALVVVHSQGDARTCVGCTITCDTLPDVSGITDRVDLKDLTYSCKIEAADPGGPGGGGREYAAFLLGYSVAENNSSSWKIQGFHTDVMGGIRVCRTQLELDRMWLGWDPNTPYSIGGIHFLNGSDAGGDTGAPFVPWSLWVHDSIIASGGTPERNDMECWVNGDRDDSESQINVLNARFSDDIVLEDNFFFGSHKWFSFPSSDNVIIRRNTILHNSGHGMQPTNARNFLIENNVIGGTPYGRCWDASLSTFTLRQGSLTEKWCKVDADCSTEGASNVCRVGNCECQNFLGAPGCGAATVGDGGVTTLANENWRGWRPFEFLDISGLVVRNNTFISHGYALSRLVTGNLNRATSCTGDLVPASSSWGSCAGFCKDSVTTACSNNNPCANTCTTGGAGCTYNSDCQKYCDDGTTPCELDSECTGIGSELCITNVCLNCDLSSETVLPCDDAIDTGDKCGTTQSDTCWAKCAKTSFVFANNIHHDISNNLGSRFQDIANGGRWTSHPDDWKFDANLYSMGSGPLYYDPNIRAQAKQWWGGPTRFIRTSFFDDSSMTGGTMTHYDDGDDGVCVHDGTGSSTLKYSTQTPPVACTLAQNDAGCTIGNYTICQDATDSVTDGFQWAGATWAGSQQERNSRYKTNIDAYFVDYSNADYNLVSGATLAIDSGLDTSYISERPCTTDNDCFGGVCDLTQTPDVCKYDLCASEDYFGVARDGSTCDVGAFEFVAGSVSTSVTLENVTLENVTVD